MEEAAPLLKGQSSLRQSRWQAAAAAARPLRSWRWRAAAGPRRPAPPRAASALRRVPTTDTTDLVPPPRGAKPLEMGHFGKWTIMAASKAHMDETAAALWWGYNMMERFRDYSVDPAFPSYSYLGPTGCSTVQRRWLSARHQPSDDEVHVVWNSGNQVRNTATIGRTYH